MWVADSATNVWSGIYLEDGLGATAEVAPLAIAAYQLLVFIVRVVGDRLVERFGAEVLVRVSGWTAVAALVLVVVAPGVPVVLAAFALLGVGLSLIPPLAFVAAAHHDPENADRAVARVNVANYAGYIVAAFGIAVVAEGVSHRAMFIVPLVLVGLIPLMARQFQPQKSQPQRH
jgi:MFS family permease